MAITETSVAVGALLSVTGVGVTIFWLKWNKKMRKEMLKEVDQLNQKNMSNPGTIRKFLFGSEKFGFFYGHQQAEVRVFVTKPDGSKLEWISPVSAVRKRSLTGLVAVLTAFLTQNGVPTPSEAKMNQYASELHLTVSMNAQAPLTSHQPLSTS